MSFTLLGILNSAAAGGGVPYWLASIGSGNGLGSEFALSGDADSNIYFPTGGFRLQKVDANGSGVWQNQSSAGSGYGQSANLNIGSVQSGTNFSNPVSGGWEGVVQKRSPGGSLQWTKYVGTTGNDIMYGNEMDSVGNVYFVGEGNNSSFSTGASLIKLNSSGNLLWSTSITNAGASRWQKVAVTAAGNIYTVGTSNLGSGALRLVVSKFNSSGALQYFRYIGLGGLQVAGEAIVVDESTSEDNLYVVGETYEGATGARDSYIAKYRGNSGALLWQRQTGISGQYGKYYAVDMDAEGYIYAFGLQDGFPSAGSNQQFVTKYDSNGNVQFQRYINNAGAGNDRPQGIISADGAMVFSGKLQTSLGSGTNGLLAKLPLDGSLTGTYSIAGGSIIYATPSMTSKTYNNGNSFQSVSTTGSGWLSGNYNYPLSNTTEPIATLDL
tara:strand:- start:370 stop:1689 length:1320 start_codon:yes stop_codon:yes gene_type:complete